MNTHIVLVVVGMCVSVTCIVLSNFLVMMMMIGEINRQRSDEEQVSYLGYTFAKMLLILGEYKRRYPGRRVHLYSIAAFIFGLVALLIAFGSLVSMRP